MNEREKDIIRVALIYMQANLTDVLDAFAGEKGRLNVNGESIAPIDEIEVEQCLKLVQ